MHGANMKITGSYFITKSTVYTEGQHISIVTTQRRIVYIRSTSTTLYSAHKLNKTEITIRSLCIAADNTICDLQQFLIYFNTV